MKGTLRLISILGLLVFGLVFALTFTDPVKIEKNARVFIESKLKEKLGEQFNELKDKASAANEKAGKAIDKTAAFAKKLSEKHSEEIEARRLKAQKIRENILAMEKELPSLINKHVNEMHDDECVCRAQSAVKWQKFMLASQLGAMADLEASKNALMNVVRSGYSHVVGKLFLDVRIFTGTNFVAFLLLFGVTFLNRKHMKFLFIPSILLFSAVITSSYFYIFNQNWFYTLIYSDYVGYSYVAYMLVVFSFFLDIFFNSAKITIELMNSVLQALNAALVPPC